MPNAFQSLQAKKYSAKMIVEVSADNEKIVPLLKPFIIPIYQRLYTWEEQHVQCLLNDLWEAYQQSTEKEYFIGAVVVCPMFDDKPNGDIEIMKGWELIDGQQRMTTLWLLASVLINNEQLSEESISQWKRFMTLGNLDFPEARLDFSGRNSDKTAMESFIKNWRCTCSEACTADCNGWLKNEAMVVARKTISRFINAEIKGDISQAEDRNVAKELQSFSNYLWESATFVITSLHKDTDKNRFFDAMNSRGIQLEKHEILKARLLNHLPENERLVYARAWDLCADINGYIPGDIQEAMGFGHDSESVIRYLVSEVAKLDVEKSTSAGAGAAVASDVTPTLKNILDDKLALVKSVEVDGKPPKIYKSFVSFPVFLLHVLRVFSSETSIGVNSVDHKKLISEFEEFFPVLDEFKNKPFNDKSQCKSFIHCLLRCRLLMDNYMIKGHVDEGNNTAMRWEIWSRLASSDRKKIRTLRTSTNWLSIAMLQNMMYFSQDLTRVPWLSETLKILCNPSVNLLDEKQLLDALKEQDLIYAASTLKTDDIFGLRSVSGQLGYGTDMHHYWFYKLEYLLWERWFNSKNCEKEKPEILAMAKSGKTRSAVFRMRHVTSIEHVSPQSKTGNVSHDKLDQFGNLALLSVSENSSYSNKNPIEKKGAFEASLERGIIQSLKLSHIFSKSEWDDDALMDHEKFIFDLLKGAHLGLNILWPNLENDK